MRFAVLLAMLLLGAWARGDDSWITAWWLEPAADAGQMWQYRDSRGRRGELDPVYRHEGDWEAAGTLLAAGWLAERALTGFHDKTVRNAVGGHMVAAEGSVIPNNDAQGVRLFGFKF